MKFDELESRMRVFETAHDHSVLPGLFMVARLDGRGFTRLTKEQLDLERPFDVRFRDVILATVKHLMSCGFRVVYGYTESDEISLMLHRDESAFAVLNLYPYSPGHLLICPYRHVADWTELTADERDAIGRLTAEQAST